MKKLVVKPDGGHDFERAIMTTDTVPKEVAVTVKNGAEFLHHRRRRERLRA